MSNPWSLTEHVTTHLIRGRLGDSRPPSVWPSDASATITNKYGEQEQVGACRRASFFRHVVANYHYNKVKHENYKPLVEELLGLQQQPDKYMRWVWEAGNLFEDYIVNMAKESGVFVASQVQVVVPEYNIVGKVDLIVKDPSDEGLLIQEVKSVYGFNANTVLGSPSFRKQGQLGTPKESNLMQAALYDWHLKDRIPEFKATRLLYGARDTGRYAEYEIKTWTNPEGITEIHYRGVSPHLANPVQSPITIDAILASYKYVQDHFAEGVIPPRDYDLEYSEEKLHKMYERGQLSRTDTESYKKILDRKEENKELIILDKKPKKELKPLVKGDFLCTTCPWRRYCYPKVS